MARRVLVSTAVIEDADLIVADEPTPGMTLEMAKEAMRTFREFADAGKAVVVITHDLELAYSTADRIVVLYAGQTFEIADASDFRDGGTRLRHPYSRALIDALPQNGFRPTPGTQPYADDLPPGCLYAARCPVATQECADAQLPLRSFAGGEVRCIHPLRKGDSDLISRIECSHDDSVTLPTDQDSAKACAAPSRDARLLEACSVDFAYKKGVPVLEAVDFSIREGEIVGLHGPSGRGKSTLGYLLSGRLQPQGGSITCDGKSLPQQGYRPVQLVYQHPERAVNPRWQLGKTLEESWNPPEELQKALGIEEAWKKRWPNELSGGELQRFCIARALNPQTRILICDEITTMLDVVTQAQVWRAIVEHARNYGMGVIAITHSLDLAHRVCDRIDEF